MTGFCHSDVVLSSVLAEEQSLFTFEQARPIQSAYWYINFKFHFFYCLAVIALARLPAVKAPTEFGQLS